MVTTPSVGDVWLVNLDPTVGSEIQKSRPCVVVSPDEMNRHLRTVIIAPMTSAAKEYPVRIETSFQGQRGQIALDQLRSVDKTRLSTHLGLLDKVTLQITLATLSEMFAARG